MSPLALVAVFVGAGAGGVFRFALSAGLNHKHVWMPLGTLSANVLGGLVIGLLMVKAKTWPAEVQLVVVTGLLGGLTTFSTFSAEVVGLALAGKWLQALSWVLMQLGLTLSATVLGVWLAKALWL